MTTAKKGTYLIEFWNGDKYVVGNNYKWWWVHAIETANYFKRTKWEGSNISDHQMFKSVQYSLTKFVDDGGLKFCNYKDYQQLIDEVAEKSGKKLLPLKEYRFENQSHELAKLDKEYRRW
jgi:hypothetical protein